MKELLTLTEEIEKFQYVALRMDTFALIAAVCLLLLLAAITIWEMWE